MPTTSNPYYQDTTVTLHHGDSLDVLRTLPDGSVDCCVTSPPYFGLRDYGHPGQIGAEASPAEYVERLRVLFAEVRRVLADDGVLFLNLGDSYSANASNNGGYSAKSGLRDGKLYANEKGLSANTTGERRALAPNVPAKNLLGIPWRVAFALQDDGWILRNAIIWSKPNAMPESVTDRLSTRYEMLFMFSKNRKYWFNLDPIREAHMVGAATGAASRLSEESGPYRGASTMAKNGHNVGLNPNGKNPGDYWVIDDEPFTLPSKTLTDAESAYIASFIDGEGSISIRRRARQIQLGLVVVNTHEGIIRWLHDRTGMGQIKQREIRNEKWRQVWEWSVNSRQAAQVLYAVYPHFRVKQQQAALALHFMATTRMAGGGVAPAEYHALRHEMAEDCAALNAGRITTSRFAVDPQPPAQSSNGNIWSIPTTPFPGSHFAVFPPELPRRCIVAGCKPGGTVLDPFHGSGTTGMVATRNGRKYVGIELNRDYLDLSLRTRLADGVLDFDGGAA